MNMNTNEIAKSSIGAAKSLRWVANMLGGIDQEKGFPRTVAFYCQGGADLIESQAAELAECKKELKITSQSESALWKANEYKAGEIKRIEAKLAYYEAVDDEHTLCGQSAKKAWYEQNSAEIQRLRQWVNDLQSGMYVNCVYCGHRYGPEDKVPSSMADALKAHIEQCPEHPMSHLKAQLAASQRRERAAVEDMTEMAGSNAPCYWCKNKQGWTACKDCRFEWRGPQEAGKGVEA